MDENDSDYEIPTFTQKLRSETGEGGCVKPQVWNLLVPGDRPPLPAFTPKRARTPDDLWMGHSHRLNREVFSYGKLEYDHWYLVESCPWVSWYCEQYPVVSVKLDGRNITTCYDMLVLYADNTLELREIKKKRELQEPQEPRIKLQLSAQEFWAEKSRIPYRRLTELDIQSNPLYLANWKKILRRISKNALSKPLQEEIMALLKGYPDGLPLGELIRATGQEEQAVWENVFALLHQGLLSAPLGSEKLSRSIMIRRMGHESP